eukprot:TRINITY_DN1001_c0_g1_i1.p2 TRINITY_DN1001_c0_g1~~TRINITY_DN1001_c0_g1_i1.p2  ORF type:complete len:272 (+),score=45.61 TRINITY_DN1001_c0_g1_i1:127-942(+)
MSRYLAVLTSFATPAASSCCDMASKMLSGALPSMATSFSANSGKLCGSRSRPIVRLLGVRPMANAAQSDIPVNRSGGATSGADVGVTSGTNGSTADGPGILRRRGRGRRGGELIMPFGGLLGELWDPFTGGNRSLKQMLEVVDRLFDDPFLLPFDRTGTKSPARGFRTPWDVVETESEFHLRFDLPGFTKDEVKVTLEDNNLIVQAEKKQGGDDKFGERARATFYTRVELPENVKSFEIKAQLKHGVLEIAVPKSKHEPQRQEIDVKVVDE